MNKYRRTVQCQLEMLKTPAKMSAKDHLFLDKLNNPVRKKVSLRWYLQKTYLGPADVKTLYNLIFSKTFIHCTPVSMTFVYLLKSVGLLYLSKGPRVKFGPRRTVY